MPARRPDWQSIDGTERSRFYWEGETLHRVDDSSNEAAIMAENHALRAAGGTKSVSFGRPVLQMSMTQYVFLQKLFPALRSQDARERTAAWQRIARDLDYSDLHIGRF